MKRIYLKDEGKKISGVCTGLSEFLNIPADILRIVFVILSLQGGAGVLIYLALAIVLPHESDRNNEIVIKPDKKRLYRSITDRKLGGVCGGLADFFGIDSGLIRLGFIISTFWFASGILLYLVMWVLIPTED